MRFWIAAFLLFLFASQALPVAALGKLCAKAQSTLADDGDIGSDDDTVPGPEDGKVKKVSSLWCRADAHSTDNVSVIFSALAARIVGLHDAEHLPKNFTGEVTTPPPDYC